MSADDQGVQRAGSSLRPRLDGRWIIALCIAILALALSSALYWGNDRDVLLGFGVRSLGVPFEDLYPFPAAQQTLKQGGDIYEPMQVERWRRPYNYPALWLAFMRFPESAVPFIGATFIAAWLAALFLCFRPLSLGQSLIFGILACSPPVILALARGNTDVPVFILVALGLVALRRQRQVAAWGVLIVAAVLKLYPAFAFTCFLRLGWRRLLPWLTGAVLGLLLLVAIQREEMVKVWQATPPGGVISYGSTVWVQLANQLMAQLHHDPQSFAGFLGLSRACAGVLVALMFNAGWRSRRREVGGAWADDSLDGFRASAGIFLGTFLLGSHYAYRLIFLLFGVPWLLQAGRNDSAPLARVRRGALGLVSAALWLNPYWWVPLYFLREGVFWGLAGTMAWLLGRTMPGFRPSAVPATGCRGRPA